MLEIRKDKDSTRHLRRVVAPSNAAESLKHALMTKWEKRATDYERDGSLVNGSLLVKQFMDDLTQLARDQEKTVVGLKEASRISGYSGDHLRRMARQGKLENMTEGRRLAFCVGELPRKPKPILSPAGFDAARAVEKLRGLGSRSHPHGAK